MTELMDEAADKFGEEQVNDFIIVAKAMRALITIGEGYFLSPVDTMMEGLLGEQFESMLTAASSDPTKASELLQALVALIVHLKHDGDYAEWFESMGVSAEIEVE